MASNGIHPRFLQAYNEKRRAATEKLDRNATAKRTNIMKKIDAVTKLREKYGHERTHMFAQFSKEECSTYLQYKKQSSKDPGMPRDLEERRARCIEWIACPSPAPSPNVSDDEGEDGEKEGVTEGEAEWDAPLDVFDCVTGLMELATQGGGEGWGGVTYLRCVQFSERK